MRNDKGQFTKGHHFSPETEFKKGQHWRPKKPYWDKDWLVSEYATKERSANDIASEFGITEAGILFWLRKHNIPRRGTPEELFSLQDFADEIQRSIGREKLEEA